MDTTTTERRQLVNTWIEPEDVERLDLLAREADRSRSAELRLAIIATIGVYGFTARTSLVRLREADVGQLLDVRQRRGVRGSDYAWANSARLQAALVDAAIELPPQGAGTHH